MYKRQLLEQYVTPGDTQLDVGTGSGILAICGIKLGASYALACDIDPFAVRVAKENAKKNGEMCIRDSIKDALVSVYDQLHLLATDKEATQGVPTGFSELDNVLVGMGKSDLVLIGARPGMGKTSFALNTVSYTHLDVYKRQEQMYAYMTYRR